MTFDSDFDDDDELEEADSRAAPGMAVVTAYKKGSIWVFIGAGFELLSDILKAGAKFFDVCMDASLSKFKYERQQQQFIQDASREIEMLTSGDYDATTIQTSGRFGSRPDESQD